MLAKRKLYIVAVLCLAVAGCAAPAPEIQRLSDQDLAEPPASAKPAPTAQGGGFFAKLLGGLPAQDASARSLAAASDPEQTDPQSADMPDTPDARADTPARHKSIFGLNNTKTSASTSEIPPGTHLPYGRVARICGLSKGDLGQQVAQYPESRPRHRIYDSAPGNTAPHSFFITGFDDGCARQFTASLAVFGSVEMHEQLRYGLPDETLPYNATDKAYEKVKSRVCGVPRKKPCGRKVSRLDKSTVFVSFYERFGSNAKWSDLLLHDGDVLAQDFMGG